MNLKDFLKFPFFCFKLVLLNFESLNDNANFMEQLIYKSRQTYFNAIVICSMYNVISMATFGFVNRDDFDKVSPNIPNVVTGSIICLKAVSVNIGKDEIRRIFQELDGIFKRRDSEIFERKVTIFMKKYAKIMKIYAGIMIFVFLPILVPFFNFFISGVTQLPLNYWFPFETIQPTPFFIATLWVEFSSYNFLAILLACDTLLYALITIVAMEFDFLSFDLRSFKFPPKHERAKVIKILVERHSKLLELSDRLQNIFAPTFLCCFVISSLVMCFVAFQL